jgi:hypothetical protein
MGGSGLGVLVYGSSGASALTEHNSFQDPFGGDVFTAELRNALEVRRPDCAYNRLTLSIGVTGFVRVNVLFEPQRA